MDASQRLRQGEYPKYPNPVCRDIFFQTGPAVCSCNDYSSSNMRNIGVTAEAAPAGLKWLSSTPSAACGVLLSGEGKGQKSATQDPSVSVSHSRPFNHQGDSNAELGLTLTVLRKTELQNGIFICTLF